MTPAASRAQDSFRSETPLSPQWSVSELPFNMSVRDLLGALQCQFGHRYPLDTLATMSAHSAHNTTTSSTLEVGSFFGPTNA